MQFETLVPSWRSTPPECPRCQAPTRRLPGRISLLGSASTPPPATRAPSSWEGTKKGDSEYIAHWRRQLDDRRRFEERHPEHATHVEAIAAHEGVFEHKPLTYREISERATQSGDLNTAVASAAADRKTTAGSHSHSHSHGKA